MGYFVLFDLNLLLKYVVSDFFAIFVLVLLFPEHALVANNSYSKIVYTDCVGFAAHDFRNYISRNSICVFAIVRVSNASNS